MSQAGASAPRKPPPAGAPAGRSGGNGAEGSRIEVCVRVRPFLPGEKDAGSGLDSLPVVSAGDGVLRLRHPALHEERAWDGFDHVFDSSGAGLGDEPCATQESVYAALGTRVLKLLFDGLNCCLFTYGQSRSGKTHTMYGNAADPGLAPRLCQELLRHMPHSGAAADVSLYELQGERVVDLLVEFAPADGGRELRVREHPALGPYVDGLTCCTVTEWAQFSAVLALAASRRTAAAHLLLQVTLRQGIAPGEECTAAAAATAPRQARQRPQAPQAPTRGSEHPQTQEVPTPPRGQPGEQRLPPLQRLRVAAKAAAAAARIARQGGAASEWADALKDVKRRRISHDLRGMPFFDGKIGQGAADAGGDAERTATLTLCDLAGMTQFANTGQRGDARLHASKVNRSLSTLSRVMAALSGDSTESKGLLPHRDSLLTWLLKEKLAGDCRSFLVATVTPCMQDYEATLSTLLFAERAHRVISRHSREPPLPPASEAAPALARVLELVDGVEALQRERALLQQRLVRLQGRADYKQPGGRGRGSRGLQPGTRQPSPSLQMHGSAPMDAAAAVDKSRPLTATMHRRGSAPSAPQGSPQRPAAGDVLFGSRPQGQDAAHLGGQRRWSSGTEVLQLPFREQPALESSEVAQLRSRLRQIADELSARRRSIVQEMEEIVTVREVWDGPQQPTLQQPPQSALPTSPSDGTEGTQWNPQGSAGPASLSLSEAAAGAHAVLPQCVLRHLGPLRVGRLLQELTAAGALDKLGLARDAASRGESASAAEDGATAAAGGEAASVRSETAADAAAESAQVRAALAPTDVEDGAAALPQGLREMLLGPSCGSAITAGSDSDTPGAARRCAQQRAQRVQLYNCVLSGDGFDAVSSRCSAVERAAAAQSERQLTLHLVSATFSQDELAAVDSDSVIDGVLWATRRWRGPAAACLAARDGDVVRLLPGVYSESVRVAHGFTIEGGADRAECVLECAGREPAVLLSSALGGIRDLTVRKNGGECAVHCAGGSPSILNCTLSSTGTRSTLLISDGDPLVEGCNITGWRIGVWVRQKGRGVIRGNDIAACGDCAVVVEGPAAHPLLNLNQLRKGKGGGIAFMQRGRGTARGNRIVGNECAGVLMESGANPTVDGNEIRGNGGGGILLQGRGTRGHVVRNEISENADRDVLVSEHATPKIEGNTLGGGALFGAVFCHGGGGLFYDNVLRGYHTFAVLVRNAGGGCIFNNQLHFDQSSDGGCLVNGSGGGLIVNNVFWGDDGDRALCIEEKPHAACATTVRANGVNRESSARLSIEDIARLVVAKEDGVPPGMLIARSMLRNLAGC
eukprot:TRINITY_DN19668_c0_g2_i1.p1 TRINITY_DN19668_c0_g2~~TRINITY_DN19668_c0_g2_i1.p1  ORF type:complete len:1344 (+),score=293.31 TRINITY_DN19668_c0_g2_i1:78-4034(+)